MRRARPATAQVHKDLRCEFLCVSSNSCCSSLSYLAAGKKSSCKSVRADRAAAAVRPLPPPQHNEQLRDEQVFLVLLMLLVLLVTLLDRV